jgi:hypothetical protein
VEKTLLERLQDIKNLAGDMLEGKQDKSFAEIYLALSDLVWECIRNDEKERENPIKQ